MTQSAVRIQTILLHNEVTFTHGFLLSATMAPYRIVFKTDADEVAGTVTDNTNEAFTNEQGELPGGIIGFNLNFVQQDC